MYLLIVEDDEENRRFLKGLIDHNWPDAHVLQAPDAKTALKLFAHQVPDITLLDIELPGLSGLDVLEIMRAIRRDAHIIMVSGHSSAENVRAAAQFGIDGFLVKPLDEQKVVEMINRQSSRPAPDASRIAVIGQGKSFTLE